MNSRDERKLLIKIAEMYYEQDMTQSEISKELGIYRTTISRLLKRVRQEGIVSITIHYGPGEQDMLERRLCERFGLKEAHVVEAAASLPGPLKLKALGQACAAWLGQAARPKDVIGFSWGSSLAAVADALVPAPLPFVTCIPMVGGPSGTLESRCHVNNICYQAAMKWNARSLMIDAPAITEQRETLEQLLKSPYLRTITALWDQLDIALFGIGSMEIKGREAWQGFYGDSVIAELEHGRVAGDICSRFYDSSGVPVPTDIESRTLTVQLEQVSRARYSVGVAESLEKVPGILGALNGGYMNVLFTTEETARAILQQEA
ncbi:sugar-binding transcriptional regulator [Paenibacillus sp. MMS20-IR301]|uniref:sugar-binding transcriptional regulator n=1 Tax=Paenibacillus sp. MMS20-IR301 TaxID=2895946 RepID=UPI0028E8D5A1|nr:sugar-binding transcriptional regulator [Paenibacillus sp. MMS20-IR301]WNS42435.1 sugar-binding transcriptional regulator [Paenibacillus sp. MMS20-IR301]